MAKKSGFYFDVNSWQYSVDENGQMFVIPPDNEKKENPEFLYKYYSLSERNIVALETGRIWASHPKQMNDPYDTTHHLIEFDARAILDFYDPLKNEPGIKEVLQENSELLKHEASYNFLNLLYTRLGILSLTENPNNFLMWSYYTGHNGFSVGFRWKEFPFKKHGPYQIHYTNEYAPVSTNKGLHLCMLYQATTKASYWKHEDEWRMLAEIPEGAPIMDLNGILYPDSNEKKFDRFFPIGPALDHIILGNRFFDGDNELRTDGKILRVKLKNRVREKTRILNFAHNKDLKIFLASLIPPALNNNLGTFELVLIPIQIEKLTETEFAIKDSRVI